MQTYQITLTTEENPKSRLSTTEKAESAQEAVSKAIERLTRTAHKNFILVKVNPPN